MKRIVFDSHAILKWTRQEPGYKKIKQYLEACRAASITGYMNKINVGEVYYTASMVLGNENAQSFLENFLRLPLTFVIPDDEMIWKAAELKAAYAMSYADCFAAATALRYQAALLTGDPEFSKVEKVISVEWI